MTTLQKQQFFEHTIYATIAILIFATPIINALLMAYQTNGKTEITRPAIDMWIITSPFFFLFLINNYVLIPEMQSLSQTIPATAETENPETLFVKSDYKVVRINIDSINYIESMSEYIRIYTDEREKPVTTLYSLQRLEARLPAHFMRVHRSYIVNMQKIKEISRSRICFSPKALIPVGENYKEKFMEYIRKHGIL
ncbi:LytTR family DNA-binding domain-containing protein [Phocaeicola sp.]|uniref:LytR/AlgR family response regulator transcription factor n=1 Tax=Phocaeicola sp. TaxID=2773926 RepID=UPI00307C918C